MVMRFFFFLIFISFLLFFIFLSMSPHFVSRRQQKIWEKQQRENAEKKASHANQSAFRYAERVFKSNIFTPEFKEIVDFSNIDNNTQETKDNLIKVKLSNDLRQLSAAFGTPSDSPQVYAIVMKNIPGLIVIPNPFTPKAQRTLVKHCLTDCAKPPHTSNLDGHYHTPLQGIWPLYKREQEGNLKPSDHGYYIPIKTIECQDQGIYTENADDDEAASTVSSMYSSIGKSAHIQSPTQLLKKQRWITLGYQYHWGSKKYNLDNLIPIPGLISDLMKAVAIATDDIGCDEAIVKWKNEYKGRDFKPEAGIINYYQLQSTLMGHVDQSELNMDAPLISLR
jgi:alkylated DNA repair protein alkB family protein 1